MPKGLYPRRTTHENFLLKVSKTEDDCWEWTGAKLKDGYGHFHVNRIGVPAHRYAYRHYKGEIPTGLLVRHKCDNPSCVNPDHLMLGTPKDNHQDSKRQGRHSHGETHGSSKHTEAQVREALHLLAQNTTPKEAASSTGIPLHTIYDLRLGRTWKHLK